MARLRQGLLTGTTYNIISPRLSLSLGITTRARHRTKVHQRRRLLAPAPLRTHELADGNVLAAKLVAEPAGLGAALVGEIALGRAVVEPKPGRITGSASSGAVPHERNVPAGAQGGPQGRDVFLGSGIFRHSGRRDPEDEQHDRQDAHRLHCIQARPVSILAAIGLTGPSPRRASTDATRIGAGARFFRHAGYASM